MIKKQNLQINTLPFIVFECIHKVLGIVIVFPILKWLFQISLQIAELNYLDLNAFKVYITFPQTYLLLALSVSLFCVYVYVEYFVISQLFFAPFKSVKHLIKTASKSIFKRSNIKVFFAYFFIYSVLLIFNSHINTATFALAIEVINSNFLLKIFVVAVVILIAYSCFCTLCKNAKQYSTAKTIQQVGAFVGLLGFSYLFFCTLEIVLCFLSAWIVTLLESVLTAQIPFLIKGGVSVLHLIITMVLLPIIIVVFTQALPIIKAQFLALPSKSKKIKASFFVALPIGVMLLCIYGSTVQINNQYNFEQSVEVTNQHMPFEVIAHRGLSAWAPSNSKASIQEALETNATYIELDVQLTRDDVPVLFHDSYITKSNTNSKKFGYNGKKIRDLTLDEIQQMTLHTWFTEKYNEKIITLAEALRLIDGKVGVVLDIKTNSGDVMPIVEVVQKANFQADIQFMSFDDVLLQFFKQALPQCTTNLLITGHYGDTIKAEENPYIDVISYEYEGVSLKSVQQAHNANKKVYVWTINTHEQMKYAIAMGVDGIITDIPQLSSFYYSKNAESTLLQNYVFMLY